VLGIWRVIQRSPMHSCSNWMLQSRILQKDPGGGRESTDAFGGICYTNFHSALSISNGRITSRSLPSHTIAGSPDIGLSGEQRAL
jgi:hypothetical protein